MAREAPWLNGNNLEKEEIKKRKEKKQKNGRKALKLTSLLMEGLDDHLSGRSRLRDVSGTILLPKGPNYFSRFVDVPSIRGRARRLTVEEGRKAIVERPDLNKRRVKDTMTSLVNKMPFAVE